MLEPQPWLSERRAQVKLIAASEHDLRQRGLDAATPFARVDASQVLQAWSRTLELSLFFASLQEAVNRLGLATAVDVVREFERVDSLLRILSRLDVERVLKENHDALVPLASVQVPADGPASVDIGLIVRAVQSLLLHCPIAALERAGHEHGLADVGHRCRLAYDGLVAFTHRNSAPGREALVTAGTAYAEARLSIDEVAALLGLSVSDAVAALEAHGFRRAVDGLRLADDARTERLRVIRAERQSRAGLPGADPGLVARDVVASQRIEDIDARPWLRT
jgi:hypothetical protein